MTTTNMKRSHSGRPIILLLFLLSPLLCAAQLSGMTANDSLKMDSMKRVILTADYMRMDSIKKDTTMATLVRSRFEKIYTAADTTGAGGQLLVQAVRFGRSHYLNFKWRSAFLSADSIAAGATLQLTFADGSTSLLNVNGAASPHSSGMRYGGASLEAEYVLAREDFKALRNKTVAAVIINYTGGQAVFNIGAAGAANIQKVCASVAEKRTTTAN
jgi:hypothetical protein